MLLLYLIAFVWYAFGVASFIFWWTREFDLTTEEIGTCLYAGLLGPIAWILGSTIHGETVTPVRKRSSTK
jgi:hypothetical protein